MSFRMPAWRTALIVAWLPLVACSRNQASEESTAKAVKVEPIAGDDVNRLILTEDAARRLDIQTVGVRRSAINGVMRKVVPYAAILYDAAGQAWTYTNPEPFIYIRARVTVESVTGDLAVLSTGPNPGESVVTVGAAELFGSEEEFEEE
jgi:hypothetical protein